MERLKYKEIRSKIKKRFIRVIVMTIILLLIEILIPNVPNVIYKILDKENYNKELSLIFIEDKDGNSRIRNIVNECMEDNQYSLYQAVYYNKDLILDIIDQDELINKKIHSYGIEPVTLINYCRNMAIKSQVYFNITYAIAYISAILMCGVIIYFGYRKHFYLDIFIMFVIVQMYIFFIPIINIYLGIELENLNYYQSYYNALLLGASTFILFDTALQLDNDKKKLPKKMINCINYLLKILIKEQNNSTIYTTNLLYEDIFKENIELIHDKKFWEVGHTNIEYIQELNKIKKDIYMVLRLVFYKW